MNTHSYSVKKYIPDLEPKVTPYSEFAHTGTIQGRDELPRINKYRVQQASMVSITRTHKRRSLKQGISLGVFTNKHDEPMMKKRGISLMIPQLAQGILANTAPT